MNSATAFRRRSPTPDWATDPASRIVRIALRGVRGPLRVDDRSHNLDMPPFGVLADEQVPALRTAVAAHGSTPLRPWRHI